MTTYLVPSARYIKRDHLHIACCAWWLLVGCATSLPHFCKKQRAAGAASSHTSQQHTLRICDLAPNGRAGASQRVEGVRRESLHANSSLRSCRCNGGANSGHEMFVSSIIGQQPEKSNPALGALRKLWSGMKKLGPVLAPRGTEVRWLPSFLRRQLARQKAERDCFLQGQVSDGPDSSSSSSNSDVSA